LAPDAGRVRHGTNLQVVYFDQLRQHIDPNASIYDNVGGGYDRVRQNGRERHLIGYLKGFLFSEEEMRKPAQAISGGEMNRLVLAKLFARPSNVLVLDEPTNDLDAETLELLEELLLDYDGTILLVSHDREFLDNVVTECLVLPGDGTVIEYSGGYSDWRAREESRRASPGSGGRTGRGGGDARGKPRTSKPAKLSYKEERELEELPDRISELEKEQQELHESLADPELYKRDNGETVHKHTARLEEVERELAAAYERWEELELIREQGER
jgi:ATP-binding cassette subfamily F protein uup